MPNEWKPLFLETNDLALELKKEIFEPATKWKTYEQNNEYTIKVSASLLFINDFLIL